MFCVSMLLRLLLLALVQVWTPAQVFNFLLIPPQWRVLFANVVGHRLAIERHNICIFEHSLRGDGFCWAGVDDADRGTGVRI